MLNEISIKNDSSDLFTYYKVNPLFSANTHNDSVKK